MKKFLKVIVISVAVWFAIGSAITAVMRLRAFCIKAANTISRYYKAVITDMIYKLNNIKEYIKVRKSPYYVLLKDAKDWEEEFN